MNASAIDMTSGRFLQNIIRFAFPLMLMSMLQIFFAACDDMFILGLFVGSEALAAVGATTYIVNLFINGFAGLSVGVNVVVAQLIGAGDKEKAGKAVHTAVAFALLLSVVIIILGESLGRIALEALDTPKNIIDTSTLYLRIYFLSTPASLLFSFSSAVMRADGVTVPIVELEMFDYLYPSPICNHLNDDFSASICFVGNLEKSRFLDQWISTKHSYSIDLIGPGRRGGGFCNYIGSFPGDIVPKHISSNFGLVWDGESLEDCDKGGNFGQYLRINNPHKFSLYIAAGIPVIVWKKSALANFVQKNEIGIFIDSISDIDTVMKKITQNEYKNLLMNVALLQEKVTTGFFLRNALNKSLEIINQ